MDGIGKRYPNLTGRRKKGYLERPWAGPTRRAEDLLTIFVVSDTHYGSAQNMDDAPPGTPSDPVERLIVALNETLPLTAVHPLGGKIGRPDAVLNLGDCIHHNTDTITRFAQDYKINGLGHIGFPCYVMDGNHDEQFVRNHIIQEHGTLFWGVKIKSVFFQAMRDNMTEGPTLSQIENEVTTSINARPAGERTIFIHHRAMNGGYPAEWGAGAWDALKALSLSKNTICHLHGHNHYSDNYVVDGIRMHSPGSITQAPLPGTPPYTTTYPEGILVLRIRKDSYDAADFNFGYDVNRNWAPNTWNWSQSFAL